jgi:hypothetical protein
MPANKSSLHTKLAQVMYEADRIPKNGTAPSAMGGFKFVQVGDAADVIRKSLAEKNVSMIPTSIDIVDSTEHPSGADGKKVMTTMTVRTTWTLTDADTGETTVIQSLGSGGDTGDKAAPKAQSNAMKYALLMGFLLSTGDDPEQTDTSDRRPAGTPAPRPAPEHLPPRDGSLIGLADVAKAPHDYEVRQTPDGPALGFKLVEGRAHVRVIAYGPLAEALALVKDDVIGQRVTAYGVMSQEKWTMNQGKPNEHEVPYTRLVLSRITTPTIEIPSEDAPTIRLFPEDEAELDAALEKV